MTVTALAQTNLPVANRQSDGRSRPVSLRECLDSALRRNLDVQIARRSPNISRYQLNAARGAHYDPVFSFSTLKQ